MRIAFDIDEMLIPYGNEFPVERSVPVRFLGLFYRERFRSGTLSLMHELTNLGCEIWIYTTSARSPMYLRAWFLLNGLHIRGVVNCGLHEKVVLHPSGRYPKCSKYPPAFGIDLLIDNSEGIAIEGRRYGFDVLVVRMDDADWVNAILKAVTERMAHPQNS